MTETQQPQPTEVPLKQQFEDYWGTDERHRFYLPDGVQYFEFKIMNEGDKAKFQKMTNQDMTIGRDQTAKIRMDPAAERHQLILSSVIDWNFYKNGEKLQFFKRDLERWLEVAPPQIVEDLEFEIRRKNPWLQSDMTLEEIDKEMDRLMELRKQVKEREEGETSSANK